MELCSLCERIREIRIKQRKNYLEDLCPKCQVEYIKEFLKKQKKVIKLG